MEVFEEFIESGNDNFNKKRYTAAVRDYATAIFLMIDIYLKRYNIRIKNHNERFDVLKSLKEDNIIKRLLDIYEVIFEIYRKTYYNKLSDEEAKLLKEYSDEVRRYI
ncbi:hypothetical protein MJ1_0307 [Nanobdella aerobiophila]|uniref:Uncharacterized protein n=1 Tax=Nanobdella aerobiophila TaxID=2586965 RepID=A0A915WRP6_9ARCH|nr:hypothetical protein [Nanobdella aerobiophila]BBL45474.1 hypothetical protein MJ1_0307 [Nanobdella aerobiophila]